MIRESLLMASRSFIPPSPEVQKRNDMNFDSWKIGRDGLFVVCRACIQCWINVSYRPSDIDVSRQDRRS